jgi:hypothetical protein
MPAASAAAERFKKSLKAGIVHFDEVAAIESIDTGFDQRAQYLQFRRIFTPPLPEHPGRVTHHLVGILIRAGFHDAFDEGVLFSGRADLASRHVRVSRRMSGIVHQSWQSLPARIGRPTPKFPGSWPLVRQGQISL